MDFRDGWDALVHVSLPWMGCESLVFLGSHLCAEHQAGRRLRLCSRLVTRYQGSCHHHAGFEMRKLSPGRSGPSHSGLRMLRSESRLL